MIEYILFYTFSFKARSLHYICISVNAVVIDAYINRSYYRSKKSQSIEKKI